MYMFSLVKLLKLKCYSDEEYIVFILNKND